MTNIFEKGLFMLTTLLLQSFALSCSATKGGSTMGLLNIDIQGFHEKFQLSGMRTRTVTLSVSKSRVADISSISSIVWSELKIKSSMIGKLELFLLKQGSTIVEINFDDMLDEDGGDSFFNFSNLVLPARKFKIKSSNKQAKIDPSFLIVTNADVITSQTSHELREKIDISIESVIDAPEFFPVFVDLSDTVKKFIYQYGPQNRNSKSFPVFYKEYDTLTDGKQGLVLFITSDNFGEHWPRKMLERMDRVHNLCIPKHLLQTVEFGSFGVDKFIADNFVTSQDCVSVSERTKFHEIPSKCSNTWASQECLKLRQG